jgi:hypothetical protein
VIVGSYTHTEHKACIAGLQNNGRLNRVLELAGVAYGPRLVPVSAEVLKKRKEDATGKVLVKCPKVPEKKWMEIVKVIVAQVKGGLKRSSDVDISSAKSVKLSKNIIPCAIASAATDHFRPEVHSSKSVSSASGSKADAGGPGSKTVAGAKKATTSIKKRIVLAIGALAEISSKGTQESTPHGQAPEVQSRVEPRGRSLEPRVQFPTTLVQRPHPEASLHIVGSFGAGRVSTCCLRLHEHLFMLSNDILTLVAACFRCSRY